MLQQFWRLVRLTGCLAFALALTGAYAQAATLPALQLAIAGAPQVMFTPKRDACDGNDVPDAPVRAYRDAQGKVVMFGLHYVNRAWRGPDLDHMKLDCRPVDARWAKCRCAGARGIPRQRI